MLQEYLGSTYLNKHTSQTGFPRSFKGITILKKKIHREELLAPPFPSKEIDCPIELAENISSSQRLRRVDVDKAMFSTCFIEILP